MSPFALRMIASIGAVAAFVAGIAGQAVRGHGSAAPGGGPAAGVRAAISDTGTVTPAGAVRLRVVGLPSLAAVAVSTPAAVVNAPRAPAARTEPTTPARGPGFGASG